MSMTQIEMLRDERLGACTSANHAFFTRAGGVSSGIYASLQCGRGADDDSRENVAENRTRAALALGLPREALISTFQHHSADVVTVEAAWRPGKAPKADAMVTATPGIALGILTADCTPGLFCDEKAKVIGAAHAGWKGALGGVLESTIDAMSALGAQRQRIVAAIGPCISQPNYQVDAAYRERFTDADSGNGRFFRPCPEDAERFRFDLPGYCLARLKAAGINQAASTGHCTYADAERFYSNRRALHQSEGDYGRGLSAIFLR